MYRLSFIILTCFFLPLGTLFAQSPHGKGFTMDCAKCHSSGGWSFNAQKATFKHEETGFVLSGQHTNINCKACHTALNFKKNSQNCVSCHADMHSNTVGKECARCHNTQSWIVENITKLHEETSFPLIGVHATTDCRKCHESETNLRFKPIGLECKDCHQKDFRATINPNHVKLNLSTDCASCHTATPDWKPASFPEHDKFYPLTGAHAAIAKDCNKCHIGGNFNNTPTECVGCHKIDFSKTTNPNHAKLNLSTDCAYCHTTKSGWTPATFPIHDDFFPLTGAHKSIANNCVDCHKGNFNNTSKDCNSCHNAEFKKTTNPNHQTLGFSTDCASCHSTAPNWSPARFDAHNAIYPLTGAHATIRCNDCHKGDYTHAPNECKSCHLSNYQKSTNPNHSALSLSTDCAACHTTNPGWKPSTFNHNAIYPLTGAHANIAVNCASCHKGDVKNTPKDCFGCHNADYQKTTNPNHPSSNFSTDCASCHSTNPSWSPARFEAHNNFFPLTGAHASLACKDCHKGGTYKNLPKDCNSCHNNAYKATANPNHAQLNLSTDCASCHDTKPSWKPSSFNHSSFYPLIGAHSGIASNCTECHKGDVKNTPKDCNGCHNNAYKTTVNPNHAVLGLSTDCASCHTTNPGWKPSTFNHNNFFALTGGHANIASNCAECHKTNVKNTPKDCNSCHNGAYKSAGNPNHAALGLSTDCVSCHTTNPGWRPSTFNHSSFALTGAHANIASNCSQCHTNGNVYNTPKDCASCHNGAFNSASNPNHVTAGFSRDCASCHTTNPGWRPSTFNHNSFPLTGGHAGVACTQCHIGGNYNNTPRDCNACHSGSYDRAANHSNINLSRDCARCHTTNPGWRPSTFNHNNHFALVGAHAAIANNCSSCHAGGNYGRSSCYDCHSGDYNRANPNHAASGFPTNCTQCHSQNAWRPANWNHDAMFPIYSGKHRGKWDSCTDCHTNSSNYSVFSCFKCHSKTEMDKEHKGKSGYVYDSNACYSCHPRGDD